MAQRSAETVSRDRSTVQSIEVGESQGPRRILKEFATIPLFQGSFLEDRISPRSSAGVYPALPALR